MKGKNHLNYLKNKMIKYLEGKKIVLLGFGKSNKAVASILDEFGIDFQIRDKNDCSEEISNFKNSKVNFICGEKYLQNLGFDIIFVSPGIRPDLPEFDNSLKKGAASSSEIDFFLKFCPTKNLIAVTGSDGKSTTTSLIYEILKKSGKEVFIGGNIGIPIISQIEQMSSDSYVVLELSSFQLMSCNINPKIAIITNISENHLDWHKNFEEYIDSKFKIFRNQGKNDVLVCNFDNEFFKKICSSCKSEIRKFSLKSVVDNGCYLDNDDIIFSKNKIKRIVLNKNDIAIPGNHNVENFMAAILSCIDFVSVDDIKWVAENFKGLEHRIEFVDEINEVKYYNDSIASSPTRVVNGSLSVFHENIILIAGGYDKNLDFTNFAKIVCDKVRILILIGQAAGKIEESIISVSAERKPKIFRSNSMVDAVNLAYCNSLKNDVVLLSPACASFGMYKNFEERGNDFKKCVLNLRKVSRG